MALNFTVSYTFSPSTTISSSQVNTNTSDVANVFNGLEAETKTLAKLKVDIDPTLALEVATKQYVDHYSTYRRPVLQYASSTVVNIEKGINGTSGQAQILFPDGNLRTDSTTTRINCNLAQVAALSSTAQSGIRTGTLVSNTWYAIYAVKVTDNSSNFVLVADTVLPLQTNFATLNINFNANGWVYLGLVRYGDNSGAGNVILAFTQSGGVTIFRNTCVVQATNQNGMGLVAGTSVSSLNYTYLAGTTGGAIPANITLALYAESNNVNGQDVAVQDTSGAYAYAYTYQGSAGPHIQVAWGPAASGFKVVAGASCNIDIVLSGFMDSVLGVGSNPIL